MTDGINGGRQSVDTDSNVNGEVSCMQTRQSSRMNSLDQVAQGQGIKVPAYDNSDQFC